MFESLKQHKNLIIGLVVVILLFVVYTMFFKDPVKEALLVSDRNEQGMLSVDRELLALLLELRSVDLSPDIFENQAFQTLEDFSRPLREELVGRDNPFLPF